MIEVSTSILSAQKGKMSEVILNLEKSRTDYFHIDVMDGKFVKKDTYEKMFENASLIKRMSNLPLDVHLMVEDIKTAIEEFSILEPNLISFHIEACKTEEEVFEIINLIKEKNARVGIAINPKTKIEEIYKFLPYIHVCLVMAVEPGEGGQAFITNSLEKIKNVKEYVKKNNLDTQIEVDGGINLATCEGVKQAGAEILVAGTSILIAKNYKDIIDELKK